MISLSGEIKYSLEELFSSKGRTKVIKILAINGEMNISWIINETNLNHSSVCNHLQDLIKMDLIQEKIFGRMKIYRFKEENTKAHCLKNFIEFWENG